MPQNGVEPLSETLRDFVEALDKAGELRTVTALVSPVQEITEIAHRASRSKSPKLPSAGTRATDPRFHMLGGPALLFKNVEGATQGSSSEFPVLINAFGSYSRVERALKCNEDQDEGGDGGLVGLASRLGALLKPEPPATLLAKLQKVPELLELARIPPKKVRSGVCQEVVHEKEGKGKDGVNLTRLPMLRCWPHDGDFAALGYPKGINDAVPGVEHGKHWDAHHRGRYITLGHVHTIHADDADASVPASRNIGLYRVQLLGRDRLAMHWHMHHDGARHWRSWKKAGKAMPVAIALGGESVLPYAATAPMPPGISELLLAGFLNHGAIPLVRGVSVPLDVPANAEIVIEGYIKTDVEAPNGGIGFVPDEVAKRAVSPPKTPADWRELLGEGAVFEGPFGDHTGFYSLPDRYPILEVTAITHRQNAIYPTTVVGLPPQEDYFLGKATERIFLPLLRTIVPDIVDYDLPMFGVFHSCAFIKIRKEYPLHARRVMHAIWGAGQMSWTKIIVVVDEDVDVHDQDEVLFHMCANVDPSRDIEITQGPLDILDHAASRLGAGGKLGIDATRKIAGEECGGHSVRQWPPIIRMDDTTRARVDARWREYGLDF